MCFPFPGPSPPSAVNQGLAATAFAVAQATDKSSGKNRETVGVFIIWNLLNETKPVGESSSRPRSVSMTVSLIKWECSFFRTAYQLSLKWVLQLEGFVGGRLRRGLSFVFCFAIENCKNHSEHGPHESGNKPYRLPGMASRFHVMLGHDSREP